MVRSQVSVTNERRVLCVFPAYAPSFGTFSHAYPLMWRVRAFMPPQGLLAIAAYMPERWSVRFIDENIRLAQPADFDWADVVFVSGMHVQALQIRKIVQRAKAAHKAVVLGGPSVSAAPELYPELDYLHIGEIGDATDELIAHLDRSSAPQPKQVRFETTKRLPLHDFPIPAYDLLPLRRYLLASVQFSSGCPYRCEFCDIPALYGRQPRLKSPHQLLAELDAMLAQPAHPTLVYFVDDNFIGNRKAARDILPPLIGWQKKHGYPLRFACEATLNLAKQPDILALMREAQFHTVFVGIETPERDALKAIRKEQNATLPMIEAIETLNSYGLEVTSGIILGLDTDSDLTEARLKEFIGVSNVPVLTINLLQALPKTPLWDRMARDGRIVDDPSSESNVRFLRPEQEVLDMWRRCIAYAYEPDRLFARFNHQIEATYPHRIKVPARGSLTLANLWQSAVIAMNLLWMALTADYARSFRHVARRALRRGQPEALLSIGLVGHHLIQFSREALRSEQNASFYSSRTRSEPIRAKEVA